jgi:Spy/CpxP family protein refolding chaperone
LVLVFAVTQVAAAAFGYGPGNRNAGAEPRINFAEELGLTAEQSTQIQELQRQHFARKNPIQDQMRATRQELRLQRFQLDVDPAHTQALIEQVGELRNQLRQETARHRTELRTELRTILTDEQLAKWSEIRRGEPCPNPDGPLRGEPGGKGGGRW